MIIYKITNLINGKIYIGQTVRELEERVKEHIKPSCESLISKAMKKYGEECFRIEIIDRADSIEELNEKETYWIKNLNSLKPKGYNLCFGGGNTIGFKHSEESRKKMSFSKKELFLGENNPFYGKKHSEKTKLEIKKGAEKRKKKVLNIDTQEVFNSIQDAARKYGLKDTHITRVCKGKRKKTGGFSWEYYTDDNEPNF